MFRESGAGADLDADLTHSEAAERFAKKRVAFKENLIDGEELESPCPRRSFSAAPQSHNEDFSPAPAAARTPPRPNRFSPRGRGRGVSTPAKRPPYR